MKAEELDLIKMGVRRIVTEEQLFARGVGVEVERNPLMDKDYILTIYGRLLGQKNLKEVEIKYPSDWLQAVKERFAPKWYLKRYPVKYKVFTFSADLLYPELHKKIKMPEEPHQVIVSKWMEEC